MPPPHGAARSSPSTRGCRATPSPTTTTITHDYDRVVVDEERLTAVLAVLVIVRGTAQGVLYAAVRNDQPIGDRAMRLAAVVSGRLCRTQRSSSSPRPRRRRIRSPAALDDLVQVIAETADPDLAPREADAR
ncbi:hypothetical protein ACI78Q_15650 [Geodermatophilus sp. SYSU D00705]